MLGLDILEVFGLAAVIFDFDFTLADSSAGIAESVNFALGRLGFPAVPREQVHKTIGLSLKAVFSILTGVADQGLADEFCHHFVRRADEVMASLTRIYDSVPEVADLLRASGFKLGIVSTKFRYRIEEILKQQGLREQFAVIIGGEDVIVHKPDPSGLLLALAQLGVKPAEAFYVGDHLVDAGAAAGAAIPFIAVLSGTCSRADFRAYQVQAFAEQIGELKTLVKPTLINVPG
jgi:phosphoglycolate phosphatase